MNWSDQHQHQCVSDLFVVAKLMGAVTPGNFSALTRFNSWSPLRTNAVKPSSFSTKVFKISLVDIDIGATSSIDKAHQCEFR